MRRIRGRQRGRAAIAYTLVLMLVLAACGDGADAPETADDEPEDVEVDDEPDDEPDESDDTEEADGEPSRLRVMLPDLGDESFDPTVMSTASAFELQGPMYDSLLHISQDGEIAPGVAESWEFSDDNREVTFAIRDDMQFHNGDDLTAEDVRFSMLRWFDPEVGATVAPPFSFFMNDPEADIEVVDDYTLRIATPNGPADQFIETVSVQQQHEAYVLPKKYLEETGDEFLQNPVGTGPWKLVEYRSGDSLLFEAVPGHPFRPTPAFDELEIAIAPEEATRVAALQNGEVDIVPITPDRVEDVEGFGARVGQAEDAIQIHMFFNSPWDESTGAISDPRVREGLSLAINRQELVDEFLAGYGTPTSGALPGEFFPGMANMEIEDWGGELYNPERAAELFEEAGYGDGFTVDVIAFEMSGAPFLSSLGEVFLSYWQDYGITGEIRQTDLASFFDWADAPNIDERTKETMTAFRRRRGYNGAQAANGYNPVETPGASVIGIPPDTLIPDIEERIAALNASEGDERDELTRELLTEVSDLYIAPSLFYGFALWGIGNRAGDWSPIEGRSQLGETYETVQPAS